MLRNIAGNQLAVDYFRQQIDNADAVFPLQELFQLIAQAPIATRQFLRSNCRNVNELNQFFVQNSDIFFIENGRVTTYDPGLVTGREVALQHYRNQLDTYTEAPHYLNFRGHIGQVDDDDAVDFINTFYPEAEFKDFLLSHAETFIVFPDETVFLIENECIDHFQDILKKKGRMRYMNLRRSINEADDHISDFINLFYPDEAFSEFLNKNDQFFETDSQGFVSLP